MNPLLRKLLSPYLRAPAGNDGSDDGGRDWTKPDNFDESVLDKEDTSDLDGSNFKGKSDDGDEDDDDPDGDDGKPEPKSKKADKDDKGADDKGDEKDEDDPEAKSLKELAKGKPDGDDKGTDDKALERKRGKMIPLERHEQILAAERSKREAAQRELQNFQGAKRIEVANAKIAELQAKIPDLEVKYNKALAEGKAEEATTLFREIRKLDAEVADAKTEASNAVAAANAVENHRYTTALSRIEAAYPVLNEDHDDFDKELMAEVLDLYKLYVGKGMTPTDALQKAVRKEMGEPKTAEQFTALNVTPRVKAEDVKVEDDPDGDDGKGKTDAEKRKEAQVKKNLDTKQPPSLEKTGLSHNKLGKGRGGPKDIMKMSDAEWDKLTAEELAEMGGDNRVVAEQDD